MSEPRRIGAVILAAGSSSRMGVPKQSLKYEGVSFVRRAATAALEAGCAPVIVVSGANAEETTRELYGLDVDIVHNSRWQDGMGTSISAGVGALLSDDEVPAAVVLLVCDQPYVTASVIEQLMKAYRASEKLVVASSYSKSVGVPALFARELFPELLQLGTRGPHASGVPLGGRAASRHKGIEGAKKIIERHLAESELLPFEDGAIDVDTPDEYSRLIAREAKKR